jgi:hypothetical protein
LIFGWGLDSGVVGTVWWSYLTVISLGGLAWSWTLKEAERPTERRSAEAIELTISPAATTEKDDELK